MGPGPSTAENRAGGARARHLHRAEGALATASRLQREPADTRVSPSAGHAGAASSWSTPGIW